MLQPKLDLTAESEIREYHINVYIYGSASDPKVSMTSEPPLPQEDIISLLATGTTISELTGNSEVLAGRAASLLFQQLYHKIFKNKAPGENVPVLNRFEVEAGNVDSRTGRQEIAAKVQNQREHLSAGQCRRDWRIYGPCEIPAALPLIHARDFCPHPALHRQRRAGRAGPAGGWHAHRPLSADAARRLAEAAAGEDDGRDRFRRQHQLHGRSAQGADDRADQGDRRARADPAARRRRRLLPRQLLP